MEIHKDAKATIFILCLLFTALIVCIVAFAYPKYVWIPMVVLMGFLLAFIIYFFRVPSRQTVDGDNLVTSVADGKVVIVEKVFEDEYFKDERIQVSIFMSFFNVHVNFWPISGNVKYYAYHPGKYLLAFLPKASKLNEHSSIAVANQVGEVFFRQIAGAFARRVVTYARGGENVTKGQQCGIIKFGSRIDIFLPVDAKVFVEVGETVRACETVIAEL